MASRNDFFIAVYTNSVKDYCDQKFFANLAKLGEGVQICVVDNSEGQGYLERLKQIVPPWSEIVKLEVSKEPRKSRFQRNVADSVNDLRDEFLTTDKKYFLIIESDVLPPTDLIERLSGAIDELDTNYSFTPWGILGCIYYQGFHDYDLEGLQQTTHVLSGCTVYKRELLREEPFRYNPDHLGAFPDAWMSIDAQALHYTLFDDHRIICKHLHTRTGARMSRSL